MAETTTLTKVTTSPKAFCAMVLHASSFKNQAVHGLLLGKSSKTSVEVEDAVPVSHGAAPTKPLVEIALGLVENSAKDNKLSIVGWYTAPALLEDTRAGPVALRMASTLAVGNIEPALIVVQNKGISELFTTTGSSKSTNSCIQAYGKDFGGQYLEKVDTKVQDADRAASAARDYYKKGTHVIDLVDHFESGDAGDTWYPSPELAALKV